MSSPAYCEERVVGAAARDDAGENRGEGRWPDGAGTHLPETAGGRPSVGASGHGRRVGTSGAGASRSHSQGPPGFMGQYPFSCEHSWWGGAECSPCTKP
jgi:hypothetical protein